MANASGPGTSFRVTFVTSGFTAQIFDLNHDGIERAEIDDSEFASPGWMEFLPGDLVNPGQLELTLIHKHNALPPIDQPTEEIQIDDGKSQTGANRWSIQGFMSTYAYQGPFEDRIQATSRIKFSGAITPTTIP